MNTNQCGDQYSTAPNPKSDPFDVLSTFLLEQKRHLGIVQEQEDCGENSERTVQSSDAATFWREWACYAQAEASLCQYRIDRSLGDSTVDQLCDRREGARARVMNARAPDPETIVEKLRILERAADSDLAHGELSRWVGGIIADLRSLHSDSF